MKQLIICPGSINTDFAMLSDKPLKLVNKTMTFHGKSAIYFGGKGCNQAVSAKRAAQQDTKVALVGCVGNDIFGKNFIKYLKKNKIKALVRKTKKKSTGKAVFEIFKQGWQVVGLDLGANAYLRLNDIKKAAREINKSKILLCQIENSPMLTAYSLKLAKKMGCFTILNPSLVPKNVRFVEEFMYPYVDLLTLNIQEAEQLLKKKLGTNKSIDAAAKMLNTKGIRYIVITLGDKGCACYYNKRTEFIPALKVKEVDTTACGDVFTGALAASILDKDKLNFDDFVSCVRFASVAGALAVTKTGASESAPERNQILSALKDF